MRWDDVALLLALLQSPNLERAGARLGVDRTTIGRRLAALEQSLGEPLFARTREGLRPTATAERLRPYAERMEHEARALMNAAASDEPLRGTVRVATTEALAVFLVTEGLLGVRAEHPELVIELLGGNRPLDLAAGEADLALRIAPLRGAALKARCVARLGFGLFASPAYLAARGRIRTPAQLAGHDVLVPGGELAALPEARWLAGRPGVHVVMRSTSMPALATAAVLGLGIAPLSLPWGDRERELTRVLTLDAVPRRPVWLVTHDVARARPAVRAVADRIAAMFRRLDPRS